MLIPLSSLAVAADGSLKLNDITIPQHELVAALKKLKAAAVADGKEILVTLHAEEKTKYERVTEVLDAAKEAGVANLTFQAGPSEDQEE